MTAVAHDVELAERVRVALADQPSVREVRMFGGLSFMVDGRLLVAVRGDGELLLRVDPERSDALVAEAGARRAEMGGRAMSPAWLTIPADAIMGDDDGLRGWLDIGLSHDHRDA